jgi:hypothetical protein
LPVAILSFGDPATLAEWEGGDKGESEKRGKWMMTMGSWSEAGEDKKTFHACRFALA